LGNTYFSYFPVKALVNSTPVGPPPTITKFKSCCSLASSLTRHPQSFVSGDAVVVGSLPQTVDFPGRRIVSHLLVAKVSW